MNCLSTSFDVLRVLHCEGMTLKGTRIQRLKLLARMKGDLGPVELGRLIGKKPNQTSDLLSGQASFGEKVARSIEAFAGLPDRWLDIEADQDSWPFSPDLQLAVSRSDPDTLAVLENVMRAALRLAPLPNSLTQTAQAKGHLDAHQAISDGIEKSATDEQRQTSYADRSSKVSGAGPETVKLPQRRTGASVFTPTTPTAPSLKKGTKEDGTRSTNRRAPRR